MTAVLASKCAGLWRRTLLVAADGSRDTGTDVMWLQGITAYVDSRGFAGTLHQRGDIFEWHHDVDLEPAGPFPDAGAMRWVGHELVETGVHENYVEHWVRDGALTLPTGALFLTAPDGGNGLLVRVGEQFGWAGGGTVVIGPVGGPQWNSLTSGLAGKQMQASGVRWNIDQSEGDVNP